MSKNLTTTAEQAFNYLKRYDVDFKQQKSKHKLSWPAFKNLIFSDPDLIKWLESKIPEINEAKLKNYSKAQDGKDMTDLIKKGTANLRATHTSEKQRARGEKGKIVNKKINEERLNSLIAFMIENLPQEFSTQDIYDLRNNNLDNTLFHKSHKKSIPMTEDSFKRKFLDNATEMKLIKKVQSGNQHRPNLYHIINTLDSIDNSNDSYESVLEYHFGA